MAVDRLGRPLRDDPFRGNARVVATSNITLSGLQTIDDVTLDSNDRVLAIGQTTASQNGLYVAKNGAWSRTRDLSTADDFNGPIYVAVEGGTVGRNKTYSFLPSGAVTVGSTSISFTENTLFQLIDGDKGDITVSSNGTVWNINAGKVAAVATRTALKALDVTRSKYATLTEAGRQGEWVLQAGSPPVTDTQEGIYVVSDTASYYWQRMYTGKPDPYWFGALGGANDDTVAIQACLDVAGSCCLRYRDDGYTFGGIIMDGQQSIESQGKVTVNCTAQVGGYMFLIRAFGVGKHVRIENLFLDGAAANTASTAIRFDTASGVVFGFRCKNVDFSNWGEAIGDIASVSNYIVDVIFEDCICFYTRGRQVYSGRSRGFITFRDFRIDHTYNTDQVTWEGARFEDVIGLELEKFDVVGPTIPTSTYQSGAIGLAILGAAGSSSVWLRRLLIDNTRGPALSISDVSNVFGVDVCLFQNLGPPLQLSSVSKSLFTNTKIVGGVGLTGAVSSSNGVSMSSCSKVVFSGLEVEANTGSGVVMVSCEDCCVVGGYSNENTGWGFLEAVAGTRNLRSGVRAIGNGTGSLVQVGAECATVDWWPNSGLFTASTVGAATI